MSEKTKVYRCDACGGIMEFDIKTQGLKCPNCDNTRVIENEKNTIVEHELTLDDRRKINVEEKSTSTMTCSGCGANIELESNDTAAKCPYCGSSYVLADKQVETLVPDGVIPFKIDKNEVVIKFRTWIKKRWLAPNELKNLYQHGGFQGIYIPYWTFDANVSCDYIGEGGKDREVQCKDEDGNDTTKTETDWYPVSGHIDNFFADVQVAASSRYKKGFFNGIQPFNFKEIKSYSPDYISGYMSENYSISLEDGHDDAIGKMKQELNSMAGREIRRSYDHARNIKISPRFYDETYKHLLLPIYATSYSYKNKNYTVIINGQTGKIQGDYPKSVAKIIVLIIIGLIIIGLIMHFSN